MTEVVHHRPGEAHLMASEAPSAAPPGQSRHPEPSGRAVLALVGTMAGDGLRAVVDSGRMLRSRFLAPDRLEGPEADVVDPAERRNLVVRPAILGFLAVLAVSVGASLPSSPFKFEWPGVWFFGVPATQAGSQWGVYFTLAAVYGGLVLFGRVWWWMCRLYQHRRGVPVSQLRWVFVLWSLPMLVIAPLFSRDAYSYAAQGEMVSHHISPYLYGPNQLGNNAFTIPVDHLWQNAPAPYGPFFLQLDGFFARITMHNDLATIVLLRLLAFAGVVLIAVCVPKLASLYKRDGAELFTLMVLNPVTIFHLIGGAHNDALMLGLLVCGLTLAKARRPVLAVVLCALATAVKAPAALGIVYVGWSWLGPEAPIRDRIRPLVTSLLLGVGIVGFFSYVSGLGWGWVKILGTPGAVRSWTAPTESMALVLTGIAHFLHIGVGFSGVLTGTRLFGLLTALGVGAWLLLNS
ncbi:MAG: polyprenol phosphomannose-dependent alpha 1,6 mannosyltransferase MptB, partial [Acidimicrobiales bacterium]|nr:polyprenol phosphomannose-dependent alpha 1,6 mannosyltransferase MptB [Acidimicrobiales bacterium]